MATTERVASQELSAISFGLAHIAKEGKLKGRATAAAPEKKQKTTSLVGSSFHGCKYFTQVGWFGWAECFQLYGLPALAARRCWHLPCPACTGRSCWGEGLHNCLSEFVSTLQWTHLSFQGTA
jgi:hypothetical protein